jgi:hypothetical protein
MSEEKKTSWGKAFDASQEPKQAAPPQEGAGAAPAREDCGEVDGIPRARNQHILPGILGKQLRAAYGELLNAPVPDSISDLIRQLEGKQPGKPATAKPGDEEAGK